MLSLSELVALVGPLDPSRTKAATQRRCWNYLAANVVSPEDLFVRHTEWYELADRRTADAVLPLLLDRTAELLGFAVYASGSGELATRWWVDGHGRSVGIGINRLSKSGARKLPTALVAQLPDGSRASLGTLLVQASRDAEIACPDARDAGHVRRITWSALVDLVTLRFEYAL